MVMACTGIMGCGTESAPRVAVEGRVTIDGKPLGRGAVLFSPLSGTPGPKAGALVHDGHYALAAEEGAAVGMLRVEIHRGPSEGMEDIRQNPGQSVSEPTLPARYNQQSELVIVTKAPAVDAEPTAQRFDFNLSTEAN